MNIKTNSMALLIHIAENGDQAERERICKEADIAQSTLSNILHGHLPRKVTRYRIFKLTGVNLADDPFPDIVKRRDAS